MWTGYTTPDNTDFRPLDFPLRPINICNALAEVELGVFLVDNTFYLNEGSVGAGVALCALVSEDTALAVESCRTHFFWS